MKKTIAFLLLLPLAAPARINTTTIAAGSTLAVNLLEIKDRWKQMKKAAKATKKATVKAARKVVGK